MIGTWKVLRILALVSMAAGLPLSVSAEGVSGTAKVIDADVLTFGDQRVILWGLDAPERTQSCRLDRRDWACYDVAFRALETLADGQELACSYVGEPDRLGRHFVTCVRGDGTDINVEMVRSGMALAYLRQSEDYKEIEKEARAAKVGLWQDGADFVEPWLWRIQKTRTDLR